jgi:hypothetical protein
MEAESDNSREKLYVLMRIVYIGTSILFCIPSQGLLVKDLRMCKPCGECRLNHMQGSTEV